MLKFEHFLKCTPKMYPHPFTFLNTALIKKFSGLIIYFSGEAALPAHGYNAPETDERSEQKLLDFVSVGSLSRSLSLARRQHDVLLSYAGHLSRTLP